MQREDVIRELASLVRTDHWAAAFVVGWLIRDASSEDLSELLAALREQIPRIHHVGHLAAYDERWAPYPMNHQP